MIVLTGASGGIGSEMLRYLTKLDHVIGIYNNSTMNDNEYPGVSFQKLQISNEEEINKFISKNSEVLTRITVVHAAGISHDRLTINHEKDQWDSVLEVNLTGNFLLTKALIPLMLKEKWGRIIHLSSIRVAPGTISYTTTKHGIIGLSKVLAKEYAKFNITSNALVLGAFNTGMFHNLKENVKKEMIRGIPSKRIGDVVNIVNAVSFFMESPFVNGASITIDGGAAV